MMAFYSVFENGVKRFRPTPDLETLLKQDVIGHDELKQFRSSNKVEVLLQKVLDSRGFKRDGGVWTRKKPNQLFEWAKELLKKGHTVSEAAKIAGVSVQSLAKSKVYKGIHPSVSGSKVVTAQISGKVQVGDLLVQNEEQFVVKAVEGQQPIGIALSNPEDGMVTVQLTPAGFHGNFDNVLLGKPFESDFEKKEESISEEMAKIVLHQINKNGPVSEIYLKKIPSLSIGEYVIAQLSHAGYYFDPESREYRPTPKKSIAELINEQMVAFQMQIGHPPNSLHIASNDWNILCAKTPGMAAISAGSSTKQYQGMMVTITPPGSHLWIGMTATSSDASDGSTPKLLGTHVDQYGNTIGQIFSKPGGFSEFAEEVDKIVKESGSGPISPYPPVSKPVPAKRITPPSQLKRKLAL